MKLRELMEYLQERSGHDLLDGSLDDTLRKALSGAHRDSLAGEILQHLYEQGGSGGLDAEITRAQAATSLGALRLRYMKDDAPVEGFRMVEHVVHAIDGAFNEEALREKRKV